MTLDYQELSKTAQNSPKRPNMTHDGANYLKGPKWLVTT
jgi:hypothetical protein